MLEQQRGFSDFEQIFTGWWKLQNDNVQEGSQPVKTCSKLEK